MRQGIMETDETAKFISDVDKDVELKGLIDGNIRGREITILRGASIQGNVGAKSIVIYGEVRGIVKAMSIKVLSTALIVGELRYKTLSIAPGARIEAKCIPVH